MCETNAYSVENNPIVLKTTRKYCCFRELRNCGMREAHCT